MAYRFNNTLSGVTRKIIIAAVIGGLALFMAWYVSRVAFEKMLSTVESISSPDEKLALVNQLYRDIASLDQIQRLRALKAGSVKGDSIFRESDSIAVGLKRLSALYAGDKPQLARIREMQKLLDERDRLFRSYLKVRNGLVSGRDFSRQLQSLSGIIEQSNGTVDTTIVTTEQKYSTTTVHNLPEAEVERQRGILRRLFGRRKAPSVDSQQVVKEEVNVTVDTVASARPDSVIRAMEDAVSTLRSRQRQRSSSFVNQEIELSNASNVLIAKILVTLNSVEHEALAQVSINNTLARGLMNKSVDSIEIIMLVFLLLTAVVVYLIIVDIGRSDRYRQELEEAKEAAEYHSMARQRFLSNMSHEIRTPLQSIIGYAEQLNKNAATKGLASEAIHRSSTHLLHIVNEVLDYSRIASGKFSFRKVAFNMDDLLKEVFLIIKPQAEKRGLQLIWNTDHQPLEKLNGDAFRLKQILLNLLGNAVKFTDAGEIRLDVLVRKQKRRVFFEFQICDTGHGIRQEDLDKIFGEFEQVDSPDPGLVQGTGLGLTIVKALVTGQGGTVDVKSSQPGGTCFTVKLRYLELKNQKQQPRAQVLLPHQEQAEGVWLLDDDKFILDLGCSILQQQGIRYQCFDRPSALLSADVPADLSHILLDIRMPEMNGMELCRILREKVSGNVKIFAITAQVLPEERADILNAGFDGILNKPFAEKDFLKILGFSEHVIKVRPDLSMVRKLAMDDPLLMEKILKKFAEDTTSDVGASKEAMAQADYEHLVLLIHRMAGRTAQLGVTELAARLRAVEHQLLEAKVLTLEEKEATEQLLNELLSIDVDTYV